jgi:hypothetical protein
VFEAARRQFLASGELVLIASTEHWILSQDVIWHCKVWVMCQTQKKLTNMEGFNSVRRQPYIQPLSLGD